MKQVLAEKDEYGKAGGESESSGCELRGQQLQWLRSESQRFATVLHEER